MGSFESYFSHLSKCNKAYISISLFFTMLIIQKLFGQVETNHNYSPSDLFVYKNMYVIFNNDTFNKIDVKGQINGKGIQMICDTILFKCSTKITSESWNCLKLFKKEDYKSICKYVSSDSGSVGYNEIIDINCYAVGSGVYKNNKKEGDWTFSTNLDFYNPDVIATFSSGIVKKVICFSN